MTSPAPNGGRSREANLDPATGLTYLVLIDEDHIVPGGVDSGGSNDCIGGSDPGVDTSRFRASALSIPNRSFIGSMRFFLSFIAGGAILGILADLLLSALRAGPTVVWTERAMTWSWMLFAILGSLLAAVVALVVDAAAHSRRSIG